ncbi:propanediol utilization protein [Desulfosporosinus orientis DSM 765]|uniref:Phosphate propanoyltransferase n=1 Tax=Desulfosporosinus orientis (strain ATCC 19365 / DSM 765 / NCIMB 8382 / VKM B-1628 / Singapore I) TaxID=768706 RepID=G7WEH0_DESOD|nr:phosphate propanoyltransferase [Desulfosporosinus orientis]AET70783.1 propanediol utilization protein [Desulfosporosinus orientis DSM 765]
MASYEELAALVLEAIKEGGYLTQDSSSIPVGISNRHIHLSQGDLETLFGAGYQLTKTKDLSQPGQYACQETVIIAGPKGSIEKVRILGPVRSESQVEILQADCFKLGVKAPVKLSGDLAGTPGITLIGPKGSVYLNRGAMIAQRHIHMTLEDAGNLGVRDGEKVTIQIDGLRGGTYTNVVIRANSASSLEFHIDTEEANAMSLTSTSKITIVK